MVAVLHSPLGIRHPAPTLQYLNPTRTDQMNEKGSSNVGKEREDEKEDSLDLIPHQLRGSLATFTQISPMVSLSFNLIKGESQT